MSSHMRGGLIGRIEAKLRKQDWPNPIDEAIAYISVLLSEPELVASLPDEVRLSVLDGCTREQIENALTALWHKQKGIDPETGRMWPTPLMERGAVATSLAWSKEDRLSVLTPRERMGEMAKIVRNGVVRRLICLFIGHDYDLRVYHKTGQVYAICRCCERLTGGEG